MFSLHFILFQPQDGIPDIFIWMLTGGKRVAYARIPAQHVIYSQTDYERGRDSGRMQTVFLRVRKFRILIIYIDTRFL